MQPPGGRTLKVAPFQVDHADIEQCVLSISLAYRIRLKKKPRIRIPSIHPSESISSYRSSVDLDRCTLLIDDIPLVVNPTLKSVEKIGRNFNHEEDDAAARGEYVERCVLSSRPRWHRRVGPSFDQPCLSHMIKEEATISDPIDPSLCIDIIVSIISGHESINQ